jgi:hypothetical protein
MCRVIGFRQADQEIPYVYQDSVCEGYDASMDHFEDLMGEVEEMKAEQRELYKRAFWEGLYFLFPFLFSLSALLFQGLEADDNGILESPMPRPSSKSKNGKKRDGDSR